MVSTRQQRDFKFFQYLLLTILDLSESDFALRSKKIACLRQTCLILFANAREAQKYWIFLATKVIALLFDFDELFILQKVAL